MRYPRLEIGGDYLCGSHDRIAGGENGCKQEMLLHWEIFYRCLTGCNNSPIISCTQLQNHSKAHFTISAAFVILPAIWRPESWESYLP